MHSHVKSDRGPLLHLSTPSPPTTLTMPILFWRTPILQRRATTHQHVADHPQDSCRSSHKQHRTAIASKSPPQAQIEKTSQRTKGRPHWFEPANPEPKPNRTPFHHVTGLQHVEGSSNSRYQVVLAKDPSYFPKTQPGPKCSSTDVEPAAPETQPLQLATQSQRRATRCNACR